MRTGRVELTHAKQSVHDPEAIRKGDFITGGKFDGAEPIVYALLLVEVLEVQTRHKPQGLHL